MCIFYRRHFAKDYTKLLIEDFNPFQSGFLGQLIRYYDNSLGFCANGVIT